MLICLSFFHILFFAVISDTWPQNALLVVSSRYDFQLCISSTFVSFFLGSVVIGESTQFAHSILLAKQICVESGYGMV